MPVPHSLDYCGFVEVLKSGSRSLLAFFSFLRKQTTQFKYRQRTWSQVGTHHHPHHPYDPQFGFLTVFFCLLPWKVLQIWLWFLSFNLSHSLKYKILKLLLTWTEGHPWKRPSWRAWGGRGGCPVSSRILKEKMGFVWCVKWGEVIPSKQQHKHNIQRKRILNNFDIKKLQIVPYNNRINKIHRNYWKKVRRNDQRVGGKPDYIVTKARGGHQITGVTGSMQTSERPCGFTAWRFLRD